MAYKQQMGNSRTLLGGIVGAAALAGALIIGLGPIPATAAHADDRVGDAELR